MKYLLPQDNLLSAATGYIPHPESINVRTSATKSGGGIVSLTGGAIADATYDIEILNNTLSGTPTVSAPTFVGVGNPAMSLLAATSAVAAQTFKVTLTDLGTDTEFAYTPFQGVNLVAKTAGAGGNAIEIEVDESGIVRTGTDFALLDPLVKDANEYVGEHWNFGAPALNPDGTIPSSAPRISFGDDPQVYRQYREFADGRYVYRFTPAPVRDVAIGARVKVVTGSRVVTTDDGATTRTYTGVTTLYSLLNAILADASAHVDVDGAVTVDNRPGGMGVTEMSVRTASYVESITRDGTQFVQTAALTIAVSQDAPTEVLTITCAETGNTGAEVWNVRGSVSGELADAVTGVAYDGADYDFTIPEILAPTTTPTGENSARLELINRADGEGVPLLCVENFVLGAEATNKTFTYVWQFRPPTCSCDDVEIEGGPDGGILGTEVDVVSDEIPADLQTPLQNLYDWQKTFVTAQASILGRTTTVTGDNRYAAAGGVLTSIEGDLETTGNTVDLYERVSAVLKVDRVDIRAAKAAVGIFHETLRDIFDTLAEVPVAAQTEWDAALTQLGTDFATINTNDGADNWRTFAAWVTNDVTTSPHTYTASEAAHGLRLLTADFDVYLERYRTWMDKIRVLAGVEPSFNSTALRGNAVWSDQQESYWFASQDGLLPIQPGFYYHSAQLDADGIPVSTQQFGIGIGLACPESIVAGDKLIITLAPNGNIRITYQVGDRFEARVINGQPLPLGGGRTGDDTQVWRVDGTVAGVLAEYELYKPTPNTYSDSGLTFKITPGGIDSVLGDEFEFFVEGGQFRYRKNGGSWSSATQIAPAVNIDVADGATISASFLAGEAPSWVIGDSYSFSVTALNTLARLCSPKYGGALNPVGIMTIPYTAAMLAGSETTALFVRNETGQSLTFYVTVLSLFPVAIDIEPGDNYVDVTSLIDGFGSGTTVKVNCGDFDAMSMGMVWLGKPRELAMPNAVSDPGVTRKRIKLGNASRTLARLGANIQHSAVSEASFAEFVDGLNDAVINHDGRFAVVWPSGTQAECGIVRFSGDDLDVEDEFEFQPTDNTNRLLRFTLPLEAVP